MQSWFPEESRPFTTAQNELRAGQINGAKIQISFPYALLPTTRTVSAAR
jgi:hypothetical protein